jgi:hypothetical protein
MSKPTGTPDAPRAVDAGMEAAREYYAKHSPIADVRIPPLMASFAAERTAEILRTLLSTAYCGTGVVPVSTSGFASLRTTAVVKQEDILRVFRKFGVTLPPEPHDIARAALTDAKGGEGE